MWITWRQWLHCQHESLSCSGWFLGFRPFLRAYNSTGSKGINVTFSVFSNVLQKTDIWGNIVFFSLLHIGYQKSKYFWFSPYFGCQTPDKLSKFTKYLVSIKVLHNGTSKTKYLNYLPQNSCTATHRNLAWYFKNSKIFSLWIAKNPGEQ